MGVLWLMRQFLPPTMCRDGWFGLPLSNRNAREAPAPASGLLRVWASVSAHAIQFEDGVNRVACRRRNAELTAELAYFSGEPIKLETIAALKIVRHRRAHARLDLVDEKVHPLVDVSMIERNAFCLSDRK